MTQPKKFSERRKSARIAVAFPVTVTSGKNEYRWRAREFSEFGILLGSTHTELVGQDVQLQLHLDGGNSPVSLQGTVVYATSQGIAVRFKHTAHNQDFILKKYIQDHARPA